MNYIKEKKDPKNVQEGHQSRGNRALDTLRVYKKKKKKKTYSPAHDIDPSSFQEGALKGETCIEI